MRKSNPHELFQPRGILMNAVGIDGSERSHKVKTDQKDSMKKAYIEYLEN